MKKICILAALLVGFYFTGTAQTPAPPSSTATPIPPPPPLIFSAPAETDLREFNSVQDGFAAKFAGDPTNASTVEEGTKITTYQSYHEGSNSMVRVYEFPFDVETGFDRDTFFENVKNVYLEEMSATLISEKSVVINGVTGNEFSLQNKNQFLRNRFLIANQRIYEISIGVSNWHIMGEAKKAEFETEADRFFRSFVINKLTKVEKNPAAPTVTVVVDGATPDEDGWQVYSFENDSLKISFPNEPEHETGPINMGIHSSEMHTYSSAADNRVFLFGYIDLGIDVTDPKEINSFYDGWSKGISEDFEKNRVINTDVDFFGRKARKIQFENETFKGEAIGIFVDGKMIQLLFMQLNEDFGEDFVSESAVLKSKFFDSFKYAAQNISSKPAINEKPDVYKNSNYKFELTLPSGWYRISADETLDVAKSAKENNTNLSRKGKDQIDKSFERSQFLFSYSKRPLGFPDNASFICVVEKFPTTTAATKAIIQTSEINFRDNLGYKIESSAKSIVLGSRVFYVIKLSKVTEGITIKQSMYFRKINSREMLQFGLSYTNDEDLTAMEESLKTLKFLE